MDIWPHFFDNYVPLIMRGCITTDEARQMWSGIPLKTDIVVAHTPPHGIGDETIIGEHLGCPELLQRIHEIQPRLVVSGHLHNGYGIRHEGGTTFVNASSVNDDYKVTNSPIVFKL